MYVVSINNCGEERNFLAATVYLACSRLNATINGTRRNFEVGQLIDIETLKLFVDAPSLVGIEVKQRRLS